VNQALLAGIRHIRRPLADASVRYAGVTNKDGPERGVCTSGRGLIDAIEERQL